VDQPLQIVGVLFVALALVGCAYLVFAGLQTPAFFRAVRTVEPLTRPAGVSILKPLHGDEPGLEAALATFFAQRYAGDMQIILGLQAYDDPARSVAERLWAAHPDRDVCVVVDPRSHGANRKVSNLVNMAALASRPILILSDSDIAVPPDHLNRVVQALEGEEIGAVTCPYYGESKARLWSRLAAMGLTYQFLPSVVVGVSLRLAQPCMGSTIAIRREVLEQIGGFEAFADRLADDYAIGAAVRAAGYRTLVVPVLVAHGCAETSLRQLLAHELRWARTVRGVDGPGFLGSAITHAFALALLGFILTYGGALGLIGLVGLATATACRLWMMRRVAQVTSPANEPWWLFPVRDILSFVVFVSSFFVSVVDWRGARVRVDQHGDLSGIQDTRC
jgi:ceramide glucosyltransferase